MLQRRGGVPVVRLEADLKVEHAAQLVGDLQELHRVHVAGEHDQPAGSLRGERVAQRRTELVQLDGVAGGAVVADREGARRIEWRPADDRVGVHDAEPGHHQHVAARRAGVERPLEKLLERARVTAVDRAQHLRFDRLALPQCHALGAGLEVEIDRGRHLGGRADRADLLERGDERIALIGPVEVSAQVEEDSPFLRRRGDGGRGGCVGHVWCHKSGPFFASSLPNSCGDCGSNCEGRRAQIAACQASGVVIEPVLKRVDRRPRERAVGPPVERGVVTELGVAASREQQRRILLLGRRRRIPRAIDRTLQQAVAAHQHIRRQKASLDRRGCGVVRRRGVAHHRSGVAAVADDVQPRAGRLGLEDAVQVVVKQELVLHDIVRTHHLVARIGLIAVGVRQPRAVTREREHQ